MGSKQINKSKVKNWQIGDTFALKINHPNQIYDGNYLIIIKGDYEWNYDFPIFQTCLLKITKDKTLPKTLDEINNLEFIKTGFVHYIERYSSRSIGMETYAMVVERCKDLKFYPDEYNYLYMYDLTLMADCRKNYDNFIYLGNFDIKYPEDEFPPVCITYRKSIVEIEDVVNDAINRYEDYNLRKSKIYNEEREIVEERAKMFLKIHQEVLDDTYEKEYY